MKTDSLQIRMLAVFLAVMTALGSFVLPELPAEAASIGRGSKTCTVAKKDRHYYLKI